MILNILVDCQQYSYDIKNSWLLNFSTNLTLN